MSSGDPAVAAVAAVAADPSRPLLLHPLPLPPAPLLLRLDRKAVHCQPHALRPGTQPAPPAVGHHRNRPRKYRCHRRNRPAALARAAPAPRPPAPPAAPLPAACPRGAAAALGWRPCSRRGPAAVRRRRVLAGRARCPQKGSSCGGRERTCRCASPGPPPPPSACGPAHAAERGAPQGRYDDASKAEGLVCNVVCGSLAEQADLVGQSSEGGNLVTACHSKPAFSQVCRSSDPCLQHK